VLVNSRGSTGELAGTLRGTVGRPLDERRKREKGRVR
jgi:hypothetical protein